MSAQRAVIAFAGALFVAAIGVLLVQATRGIDLYDEAFYLAVPYRMWLGGRLFIDELAAQQTFGVLAYPVVWARGVLRSSSDGLVLDLRWAFLAFWSLTHLAAAKLLRRHLDFGLSLAVVSAALFFLPGDLVVFSYNTFASMFLLLGFLFLWGPGGQEPDAYSWGAAGLLHGLAVVAYPPLAPLLALGLLGRSRARLAYLGCAALPLGAMGILALTRLSGVREVLAFAVKNGYASPFIRLQVIFVRGEYRPFALGLLFSVLGAAGVRRYFPSTGGRAVFAALLPLAAFAISRSSGRQDFSVVLMAFAPALAWLRYPNYDDRRTLLVVWLPSAVAGLLVATSSYWLMQRFLIGAAAGYFLTVTWACTWFRPWVAAAWLGVLFANQLHYPASPFNEDGPATTTYEVKTGPYRGISTHEVKAQYLNRLAEDLAPYRKGPGTILSYQMLPAAYLLTERRPAKSATMFNGSSEAIYAELARHFSGSMAEDSLVIHSLAAPLTSGDSWNDRPLDGDELDQLVKKGHSLLHKRDRYEIYVSPPQLPR